MVTIGFMDAAVAERGEISRDAELHRCQIRRVKIVINIDIILILGVSRSAGGQQQSQHLYTFSRAAAAKSEEPRTNVRGSRGIAPGRLCDGLFTVQRVPLAVQLAPNLHIGVGARDLAPNHHNGAGRNRRRGICRLIELSLRNGRAGKQRNAQGRQD
jgi:hypothetical protein